jgi:8-oxo-dGTP diphosphatase
MIIGDMGVKCKTKGPKVVRLPYTICFCYRGDSVLVLLRARQPNQGRWNGLGGKFLPDETPRACVRREMLEEAGIDLHHSPDWRFGGVVTWASGDDPTSASQGMYVYVAELPSDIVSWPEERVTPEGMLAWKPLKWICKPGNAAVVSNIPHFLPVMLDRNDPCIYACTYCFGQLIRVRCLAIPEDVCANACAP